MQEREKMAADMLRRGMTPDKYAIAVDAGTGRLIGPVPRPEPPRDADDILTEELIRLAHMAIMYVMGHSDYYNRSNVSWTELKAQAAHVKKLEEDIQDGRDGSSRFVGSDE